MNNIIFIDKYVLFQRQKAVSVYAKNGNKVPYLEGAVPLMGLPQEFPKNVDKDWYINETYNVLKGIGYYSE